MKKKKLKRMLAEKAEKLEKSEKISVQRMVEIGRLRRLIARQQIEWAVSMTELIGEKACDYCVKYQRNRCLRVNMIAGKWCGDFCPEIS